MSNQRLCYILIAISSSLLHDKRHGVLRAELVPQSIRSHNQAVAGPQVERIQLRVVADVRRRKRRQRNVAFLASRQVEFSKFQVQVAQCARRLLYVLHVARRRVKNIAYHNIRLTGM